MSHPTFELSGIDLVSLIKNGPQEGSAEFRVNELLQNSPAKKVPVFCLTPQEDEDFLFSLAIRGAADKSGSLYSGLCRAYLKSESLDDKASLRRSYWAWCNDFD